jgi:diaminopimelate decarboxylase
MEFWSISPPIPTFLLPLPDMHHFHYRNGQLHCEERNLQSVAEEHGTPLYVYSANTVRDHYRRLDAALAGLDHHIAYAVKANSNLSVLGLLGDLGSGFDIVSGGELFRVIKAGGDPRLCSFAGVGKTAHEIKFALEHKIYCFNIESVAELDLLNEVAGSMRAVAPIAVRINPNVDAKTHEYISTGKAENKFGVDYLAAEEVYQHASTLPHILVRGVQMHIGSQLTTVDPFVEAVERVVPLAAELKARHNIEFFSIGGGIGIVYDPALASGQSEWWEQQAEPPLSPEIYATELVPRLTPLGLKILLEPGRYMVGNAGVLLTTCLYEKKGHAKNFKVVDAGMSDLIRPALYQGHHEIVPVRESAGDSQIKADVVGPICESGDFFCQDRDLADFHADHIVAIMSAGAYSFTMASNYNSRPMPAEVLIDGAEARVVRRRQTLDDLIALEL